MKTTHRRWRANDAPMPMPVHVAASPGTEGRTLVARFPGAHFLAEREGDELRVYALNKGGPLSIVVSDRATSHQSRLRALNQRFAEIYGQGRR